VIGILPEEVDKAVERLQALFDEKIRMFEEWARENEFDPAWFDEESDSEDDDDEDDDEDEKKGEEQEKAKESEAKPNADIEMKDPTPEVAAAGA
jgi:hypothetical protein